MDYSKILNISTVIQSPESAVAGITSFLERRVQDQEMNFDLFINQDNKNDVTLFKYVRSAVTYSRDNIGFCIGGLLEGANNYDMLNVNNETSAARVFFIDFTRWYDEYDQSGSAQPAGTWILSQNCIDIDYYIDTLDHGEHVVSKGILTQQGRISDITASWGNDLANMISEAFQYYCDQDYRVPPYVNTIVQSHITCGNHIVSTLQMVAVGTGQNGADTVSSIGGIVEDIPVEQAASDLRDDLIASKTYICALSSSVYDSIADRLTSFKQNYETKVGNITSAFQSISEKFNSLLISCTDPWTRIKGMLGSLDTTQQSDNRGFASDAADFTGANPVSAFTSSVSNVLNVVGQVVTAAVTTVVTIISPIFSIVSNAIGQLFNSVKAATKSIRSPFDIKSSTTYDDFTFNNQAIHVSRDDVSPDRGGWVQANRLSNHYYYMLNAVAKEHAGEILTVVLPFVTLYFEMPTIVDEQLGRLPQNIYVKPHLYANDLAVGLTSWYNWDYTVDNISKHFTGGADAFGPVDTDVSDLSRSERVDYENLCFKRFIAAKNIIPYILSAFDPEVHSGLAWGPGGYYHTLAYNINNNIWNGGLDARHFLTQYTASTNTSYDVLPSEATNNLWFIEACGYQESAIETQDHDTLYIILCDWVEHFLRHEGEFYPYTWVLNSLRGAYAIKTDTENGLAAGYAIITITAAATSLIAAAAAITCKTLLRRKAQKARLDADLAAFGSQALTDEQYKEWRRANMKANFLGFLAGTNVDDSITKSVTDIASNASASRYDIARNAASVATDFLAQNGLISENQAALLQKFLDTNSNVDSGNGDILTLVTSVKNLIRPDNLR